MSIQKIVVDKKEFAKKVKKEDEILEKFSSDPFIITYFLTVNDLKKILKTLTMVERVKTLFDIFKNKDILDKKKIREILKNNFNVNDSTIQHHLNEILESGFFNLEEDLIRITNEGILFIEELQFLKNKLEKVAKIENSFQILAEFFNIVKNKKRLYILKSLSDKPLSFSDISLRVNIMKFLSELEYEKVSSPRISYDMRKLKDAEYVEKKGSLYYLTETGEMFYKFINIILLKITELRFEVEKPVFSKTIEEIGFNKEPQILEIGIGIQQTIFEKCLSNPIAVSVNHTYLGVLKENACIKIFTQYEISGRVRMKNIRNSIIKIPPVDIKQPFFRVVVQCNRYNTKYVPISKDDIIVGNFEFEQYFMERDLHNRRFF